MNNQILKTILIMFILLCSISIVSADYKTIVNPYNFNRLQFVYDGESGSSNGTFDSITTGSIKPISTSDGLVITLPSGSTSDNIIEFKDGSGVSQASVSSIGSFNTNYLLANSYTASATYYPRSTDTDFKMQIFNDLYDFLFLNTAGDEIASVDSSGNATFNGDLQVNGDATIHQDALIESDLTVGQEDNQELFYIESNGTNTNMWAHDDVPLNVMGALSASSTFVVDGATRFNDNVVHAAGTNIIFHDATTYGGFSTVADDGIHSYLGYGDGQTNRNFIFVDAAYRTSDHDHDELSDDPTVFIQGLENPDNDNTKWGSLSYSNATDEFQVNTGEGSEGVKSLPTLTAHNDLVASADIKSGDLTNPLLFSIEVDGDYIVIKSETDLPFKFSGNNNIYFDTGASLSSNSTCIILTSPAGTEYPHCD